MSLPLFELLRCLKQKRDLHQKDLNSLMSVPGFLHSECYAIEKKIQVLTLLIDALE